MEDKRILYEDELVQVTDVDTKEVLYKGIEDYEELKRENWKYNKLKGHYTLVYKGVNLIKEKM